MMAVNKMEVVTLTLIAKFMFGVMVTRSYTKLTQCKVI
jgi:hypothetical protein